MLIFQGVLFLPCSRNRRNSKWTSSWFSIENVLKVDFLFAYVYLLKGDLRKLNKNGDIEILYSYIIYFFSNFLHINWCSNSGLLDFRCGGPNSHSCITSPWSFLPRRWVPSNHRKIPLQAFQQALHVGYGMGRHAGKWLVRKMFHFFLGGCHRCFAVKYSNSIVDTQSDIRSTWRKEHLREDVSRSDDWFNFCPMSDECEFCNNSKDVSSSSSEIKEIFLANIAMFDLKLQFLE